LVELSGLQATSKPAKIIAAQAFVKLLISILQAPSSPTWAGTPCRGSR
jgi:hypothetical protein